MRERERKSGKTGRDVLRGGGKVFIYTNTQSFCSRRPREQQNMNLLKTETERERGIETERERDRESDRERRVEGKRERVRQKGIWCEGGE